MSTWVEKRATLPPIDLSSIFFEDEEDEYECSSPTSSGSTSVSSSLASSPTSSSTSSPPSTEPLVHEFLESTDRNTDFFRSMEIRPFELRVHPSPLQPSMPNNNGIDLSTNGPKGQVAPVTRPPNTSQKWGRETKSTIMRQVTTTVHKLAPTNRSTDFLWPMGIRPFELRGPPRLLQFLVPNNNGIDEIINGPKGQMAPVAKPPYTSPKWSWEPSLTMMRHVTTIVHKLEPADRSTDFLWPMGIRPLELRRSPPLVKAVAPDNNGSYEIFNGSKWEEVPVTSLPNKSLIRDWEPTLTMMRHVWTVGDEKEELLLSPLSPGIESGNGMRLVVGVIGFLAFVGLCFLA